MHFSVTSPTIDITNGIFQIEQQKYRAIGFGTAYMKKDPNLCFNTIKKAIELGYRIIDTATRYDNFNPLQRALEGSNRHEFYIISKAWHDMQNAEDLKNDLAKTLKDLHIGHIDAYLLHWPNSSVPIEETLGAIEELKINGYLRHFGLSNVNANHVRRALEAGMPITWVQMEMNPFFYDSNLLDYCQEQSIGVQASAPLHEKGIDQDSTLSELGKCYEKTAAQIALRWILQHNCIPLPRSTNPNHMQENLDVLDFTLSDEEMQMIDERAKGGSRSIMDRGGLGFPEEFNFSYEQCWPAIIQSKKEEVYEQLGQQE